MTVSYDLVVPTVGRPSLQALLLTLAAGDRLGLGRLVIVDDRADATERLSIPAELAPLTKVLRSGGRGPAAARNAGWRVGSAPWVVFLDDDVLPGPGWFDDLWVDLARAEAGSETEPGTVVGAVQGVVTVPLPDDRRPTDVERDVAGLAHAAWITADLAYRREALELTGGFDEGFPRAFREDADLALRVQAAGYALMRGRRRVTHPVRPAPWWASVSRQRGNADDARMAAKHGRGWREAADAPRGRYRRHVATVALGAGALGALTAGRRRAALAGTLGWAALTAEFAVRRIAPGPRTPGEVAAMVATSIAIPPVAVAHRLRGELAVRRAKVRRTVPEVRPPDPGTVEPVIDLTDVAVQSVAAPVAAVLLDRDGTLVVDVPYNGDPARVELVPDARTAVGLLHDAGVPVAVVSNQSGIARGLLTVDDVHAVNARVDELLGPSGPIDAWLFCPHGPDDGCSCRKPAPGLVDQAAARFGVPVAACVLIGDIGADVEAARNAGARGILVPTAETRTDEVVAAPEVAGSLLEAVRRALAGGAPDGNRAVAPGSPVVVAASGDHPGGAA